SPGIVEGPEWVFDEKYDGIRAVAGRERGRVKIWSRTLQDLTGGFPHVVAAVEALGDGDVMVDGELVALDAKGVSRFQLLQRRGSAGASPTRYAIFDLVEEDGRSLMSRPLCERRAALERLVGRRTVPLFVSRRLVRDGKAADGEAAIRSGAANERRDLVAADARRPARVRGVDRRRQASSAGVPRAPHRQGPVRMHLEGP